jgi:HAD superfamily hydrolase (TIGR01490 family)
MNWDSSRIQFFFGIWVKVAFGLLGTLELPFMLFAERFVLAEDRPRLWRLVAHWNARCLLHIAGIDLHIATPVPQHDAPVIYVSNHPSMLDGFLCLAVLGSDLVALIAPYRSFPFPFSVWMKKSGSIDICRDDYDALHYPEAHPKRVAIEKLIDQLHAGNNVLIFPEGHVERTKKLHYIHTGAARLALRAKRSIQPMSLVGVDRIHVDEQHQRPGRIVVRFGERLDPPALSAALPFRKAVKQFSKEIERSIVGLLPVRYLPDYYAEYKPHTAAVFVDIDKTIYHGYSQEDFVKYLLKRNVIKRRVMARIFYWMTLEKFDLLPHRQLMRLGFSLFAGWKTRAVDRLVQDFFDEIVPIGIQADVLPMLKDHRAQGHMIVLVTEVFQPLAKQFQKYFDATAALGTVLQEKNGVYTGNVRMLCYKQNKAKMVKEFAHEFGIDLRRSYALADSYSDLPLFNAVGHRTAVHPDVDLKRVAHKLGWEVLA